MAQLAPEDVDPRTAAEPELIDALLGMIRHPGYPCLGARSVVRREGATFRVHGELGTGRSAAELLADLGHFAAGARDEDGFSSFIALFRGPDIRDEQHFEELLWAELRALHAADAAPWAPEVSADPTDPHFAFSVAGTAYFVVGLHPRASRDARRAPCPTLVFNLHDQFVALRASGGYVRMRDMIRSRDTRLQGEVNPMVSDHGTESEARQYAGRSVGRDWRAPFPTDPPSVRRGPHAGSRGDREEGS